MDVVEQGLRRVIGVDGGPDGRVDGLDDDALLELHRSLVLLRTYDERSVVYHSQGRIGTYAIFRGHEAIQAGLVHALERRDWIFPSYRDSAIGLLRGLPAATILQWWRGHPPAGGTRRTSTSPRSASPSRRRSHTPPGSRGGSRSRGRMPWPRSSSATAPRPRARSTRAPTSRRSCERPSSCSATTTSGRSRRRSAHRPPRRGSPTRQSATGCPGPVSTGTTCSRCTRRCGRRSRERARVRGRASSRQ